MDSCWKERYESRSKSDIQLAETVEIENFEGEKIKQNLLKQLTGSVLWYDTIINMKKNNIDTIIEVGPKQVLSKLINKISPSIKTISIDKHSDLLANGVKIHG